MAQPTIDNPKIKFVKKAGMWVKTYFQYNEQSHTTKQIQEWSMEKPE
jgi:hypothetical protein